MNTNNKVYIISQTDGCPCMEVTHATLDREKAKDILRKIILDAKKEAKENGYKIDKSITRKDIEEYIDTLTSDPDSACSDVCDWVDVWCDIIDME